MKCKWIYTILLLVSVSGLTRLAEASGKLYARFPNLVNSPIFDLQLKKFTATVEIQDQLAVVHVDETFFNDNVSTLEGIYFFEMPEGSKLTEMALWIDGQRVTHAIKRREQAVQQYEQIVRRAVDPLLAEQIADNVFRLRLFPLPPRGERRIEIKYIQPLPLNGNAIEFLFPLRLENYAGGRVDSAQVHIDIKTQTPLDSVRFGPQIPPATAAIRTLTATHHLVDFKATNTKFEYDFTLYLLPRTLPVFTALSYVPADTVDDGYYLLWVLPPPRFFPERTAPRQFVFCADISASMIGQRLSHVKQAIAYFVDQLQPDDRFNVVAFNNEVTSFAPALVHADALQKAQAKDYISSLAASGLTNLNAALLTALAMVDSTAGQAQILVISDGQPTFGEVRTDSILANVRRANTSAAQIFPIGLGNEVDEDFFRELAQQNHATALFIREAESVAQRLVEIYGKITSPILTDVRIIHQGVPTYDTFPATLPNLSKGTQLLQTRRYLPPGTGTLRLQANNGLMQVDTAVVTDLREVPGNKYVSRYWAAQKIQALLKDIERFGERPELVDAVIVISITYSVLSPYTAFLVVEPGTGTTVVDSEPSSMLPHSFSLAQNYPNPFSVGNSPASGQSATTIRYTIPQNLPAGSVRVEVKIYNLLGQLMKVLVSRDQGPGEYEVVWDGTDEIGGVVAAGIYIVRMVTAEFVSERKVMVLR